MGLRRDFRAIESGGSAIFPHDPGRTLGRTLLHVPRLTDKATSLGRRQNLTIQNLPQLINNQKTKEHVSILVGKAVIEVFAAAALTAAALGSSCGEEACGLFGELFKKLEVRAVPGIRVEDQPGIR
jgi:hypothetical protein